MKKYEFAADIMKFAKSVIIECPKETILDFDVFVSSAMQPGLWRPIQFSHTRTPNKHILKFCRSEPISFLKVVTYGTSFDPHFSIEYDQELNEQEIGNLLSNKTIAFLGCARNCSSSIERSIRALIALGEHFKESQIVIYENDSTDATRTILEKIRCDSKDSIQIISESNLDERLRNRTMRLSYARNLLINQIPETVDYVCMVDLDGPVDLDLPGRTFYTSFNHEESWDAVFPVYKGSYYDIWALRHKDLSPNDYHLALRNADASLGLEIAKFIGAFQRTASLTSMVGWTLVQSAFGGLGIYKRRSLIGLRYRGMDENTEICEHVSLHEAMNKLGYRLYINPSMIVNSEVSIERKNIIEELFASQ